MSRSTKTTRREPSSRQRLAAARAQRLRGTILVLLGEQAPESVDAEVLLGVLERLHYDVTARQLAAELEYLRQRGYVAFASEPPAEPRRLPRLVRITLTARGADLLEGTLSDPGIALG